MIIQLLTCIGAVWAGMVIARMSDPVWRAVDRRAAEVARSRLFVQALVVESWVRDGRLPADDAGARALAAVLRYAAIRQTDVSMWRWLPARLFAAFYDARDEDEPKLAKIMRRTADREPGVSGVLNEFNEAQNQLLPANTPLWSLPVLLSALMIFGVLVIGVWLAIEVMERVDDTVEAVRLRLRLLALRERLVEAARDETGRLALVSPRRLASAVIAAVTPTTLHQLAAFAARAQPGAGP